MANRVGQRFGNYLLIRLLGRGGFADVYLGEHIYLKTHAAVKTLHTQLTQQDLEGFLLEAQTIARLRHHNIVRTLDFGMDSTDNTPYLVMDFAPNGTLRQCHSRGAILPLATVISYMQQVTAALQYAHNEKVIHRDVKPENMLLGPNNEVLVSDFGIAAVAHSTSSLKTQVYSGTVHYSAPEQIQGKPRPASDQYALGIVVYEWLTGSRPFDGSSHIEVAMKHISTLPPPLRERVPSIPTEVEEVVLQALAKDPKERFASLQAFAIALEQAAQPNIVLKKAGSMLLTYYGHSESVHAIAWSANARYIASASSDKTVQVWEAASGRRILPPLDHSDGVLGVAWSPDGTRIASCGMQGVQLWDTANGKHLSIYSGHSTVAHVVVWSPDGMYIASASHGGIQVWDARNGGHLLTYKNHPTEVRTIAWSPDGTRIASAGGRKVHIWNATNGNLLMSSVGHSKSISDVAWSPDGSLLASCGDKAVQIREAMSGLHVVTYRGHSDNASTLTWSPDGKCIASADDGTVQIWEAVTGKQIIARKALDTTCVRWAPKGPYIASNGKGTSVQIWQTID